MTTLTPAQVAGYVIQAGFKNTAAIDAISVALAESGGRTDVSVTNHDKWKSRDRGLFQINSHWHPEVTDAAAFNPAAAAAAAYKISKAGTDWHEWSTWPVQAATMRGRATLAVQQYLSGIANGIIGGPITLDPLHAGTFHDPTGIVDAGKSTAQAVASIAVILAHAGQWVADPHNMLRIVMVAAGAGATLAGLVLLAKSGAAGSTAQSAANTTTKAAGDAVKVAALA